MPRKNRRKLHRELRLAAEVRRAEQVEARRRRQAETETTRALAEAALRGDVPVRRGRFVSVSSRADAVVASILALLRLAGVCRDTQRRVDRLVRALHRLAPGLADVDGLPWFVLLARQHWVRAPGDWQPPGGSARRQRDAFAQHLLTRYPVPVFLMRALDVEPLAIARVPVEDEWAVGLLARLGQGVSARSLVGTPLLPVPLTRRMVHDFLSATADTEPVAALRSAQVLGLGGSRALARAVLRTRLGRLHGPDRQTGEPFWHQVLTWVCAREALHGVDAAALEELFAWVEAHHRRALAKGASWSLKGRTADSALRDASEWAAQRRRVRGDAFPASGLLALREAPWSVVEIDTDALLVEEGRAMSHCAHAYRNLIRKGKASLWSLQRDGRRRATVEVALGAGRVVQAKGARNEACSVEELEVVRRWAEHNRLSVRLKP
jgi:hypothetical protein